MQDGQAVAFVVAGMSVLLVQSAGSFHAIADRCSHADQELACGMVRNGWIACPAHGTRFLLETGEPLNPPANEAIEVYPLRIVDGLVEICLEGEHS